MHDVKPDQKTYHQLVRTVLENREAIKKDKNRIVIALNNYTRLGSHSRFRDVISKEELENSNPEVLQTE